LILHIIIYIYDNGYFYILFIGTESFSIGQRSNNRLRQVSPPRRASSTYEESGLCTIVIIAFWHPVHTG